MPEYDYVIVGGGSAGCVLASRLTENPNVTVCLIEAGGRGENWLVKVPGALGLILPTKINNWAFQSTPQVEMQGRTSYQPRGRVLGGTSAINAMIYMRAHPSDYDLWSELGNDGWSFKEVLPYFKKSENNLDFQNSYHGNSGPLPVSLLPPGLGLQKTWLKTAEQAGFPINQDFNGASQDGLGVFQFTQKNGERWSSARAFIQSHRSRANIHILENTQARKVLFLNRRATGVEINRLGINQVETIKARKEVILSAGTYQSPQLLQLSGIGDSSLLRSFGIDVVHHLPGVGQNLHDHPSFTFLFKSSSADTLGLSLLGLARAIKEIYQYIRHRKGLFVCSGVVGGGFVKTEPHLNAADVQFHLIAALVDDHCRKMHLSHGFSLNYFLLRPNSRGAVTLKESNPLSAPLIDSKVFSDSRDLETMIRGFKIARRLAQTRALSAMITQELYTDNVASDDEICAVLKARCDHNYHPAGTCKMGVDEMAVVDSQLRVHGFENLRVVDASIMPTPLGGNIYAPTVMIAEKAAEMILKA